MDLATSIRALFDLINILIIIRIVLSWIRPDPSSPVVGFIYQLSEPLLAPFKRLIPVTAGGLDFSPLLAIIVYRVLRDLIISLVA